MAYTYLLDMCKIIDQRLADTIEELEKLKGNPMEAKFVEGRKQALSEFQNFLTDNYIPKLPRRIRENHKRRNNQ